MGEVISIDSRAPHLEGKAKCLVCGHEWHAVAPVGVDSLECSECHAMRGYFVGDIVRGSARWQCNCGGVLFVITPEGTYCPRCGERQRGF